MNKDTFTFLKSILQQETALCADSQQIGDSKDYWRRKPFLYRKTGKERAFKVLLPGWASADKYRHSAEADTVQKDLK